MRDVWGYESGGQRYALVCLGDRMEIVNCTNPASVSLTDVVFSTSGDLKDVKTYLQYAYAINQFGPMQIFNLSNPAAAFMEGQFSSPAMPAGHNLFIDTDQGYAYASNNGAGVADMRILDLAVPTLPAEVGFYGHPNQPGLFADAHDAYARNDTAWVSYLDAGFAILDVRNKSAPGVIALVSYPLTTNHNVWMGRSGEYVYTTDERGGGHTRVWDTRDMRDVRQAADYIVNPSGSVHNVIINGDFAFISHYVDGVRILDIEDPADPIEVAYYDTYVGPGGTYSGCWGVYPFSSDGMIYATDRTNGLFVLEWDSTQAGRVEGTVTTGHNGQLAEGVKVTKKSLDRSVLTDSLGGYSWRVGDGPDTLVFERAGFLTQTIPVTGILGSTEPLHVVMQALPTAQVVGRVQTMADGTALSSVAVGVMGDEFFDVTTDGAGDYVLDFVLADSDQVIAAAVWGYRYDTVRVHLSPGAVDTVDFLLVRGYQDHFELDLGWTSGAADDDATGGFWQRVDPVGTKNFANFQTQPEDDFDSGVGARCFVTEQATTGLQVTVTDVDGGHTSLVSPFINLTTVNNPAMTFKYWFVNNAGDNPNRDTLWFELSADSGQTWSDIGSTRFPLNNWWTFNSSLQTYKGWPQPLLFRVRAVDSEGESVVEVAVDAFEITGDYLNNPRGDIDQNGAVTAGDVVYLVNYVLKGGPAPLAPETGDVNSTCSVTSADVIYLVNFVFKAGPEALAPCVP